MAKPASDLASSLSSPMALAVRVCVLVFFFITTGAVSAALREDNITDQEVREIQAQVDRYFPGIIVMIDGVQAPCDCREGSGCTAQVNLASGSANQPVLMRLSRINGEWVPGVVWRWAQEWKELRQQLAELQSEGSSSDELRRQAEQLVSAHRSRVPVCEGSAR